MNIKSLFLFVFLLLFLVLTHANVDQGFKDRILSILDAKGELSAEDKARLFDNMRVAGGKKTIPNEVPKQEL